MRYRPFVLVAVLCAAAVGTASAQKSAPRITRDADRDGVPDMRDRCPGTAAGIRVDASGCQVAAEPQRAAGPATPTPAAGAPAPARAAAVAPPRDTARPVALGQADTVRPRAPDTTRQRADSAGKRAVPAGAPGGGAPAAAVTPNAPFPAPTPGVKPGGVVTQAAQPAAANQAAREEPPPRGDTAAAPATPAVAEVLEADMGTPTVTGGFFMPPSAARRDSTRLEYLRLYVLRLDSAIGGMIEVFYRTAPAPLASEPAAVAGRVRSRWNNCRNIYFDLLSFGDAMALLRDSLTGSQLLGRATLGLTDALENTSALQECDNVVSAIDAPARWRPWGDNYARSIQHFYRDWYTELRSLHDANRTLMRALNAMLPAERRVPLLPALPPTAPTLGGG